MQRLTFYSLVVILFCATVTFSATFEYPLTVGSSGTDVTTLQQTLKDLGLFNADVTGFFGPVTQKAVQTFQSKNLLASPDAAGFGFVGPKTRELLNTITSNVSKNINDTIVERTTPILSRDLYIGLQGDDVRELQIFLKTQGFYNYSEITGYFGEVTKNAVASFQKINGITMLGRVGPQTRAKIAELSTSGSIYATKPVVSPILPTPPTVIKRAVVSGYTVSRSPALPVLSVTVSEDDADNTVTPNQSITYTISIENSGETDASTSFTASIPTDMGSPGTFNYTNCGSPSPSFSSPTLTVSSVDISIGETCIVTFIISVDTPLNESTSLTVSADVAEADEGGNDPTTTSASALSVDATPALSVTSAENDADNTVSRDQDVTYTLTIDNTGDGLATGVDLTDTITGDVGNVGTFSFSNCGSDYVNNSTGQTLNVINVEIAVATDCVITYHVSVDSDADNAGTITNSADVGVADEGGNNPNATSASTQTVEVPLVSYWADGESVGNLTSSADWQEISGITNPTLSANSSYLWMQSDGSIDKIFAVSTSNAATAGEWSLSGINGSDYEDLSSARVGAQSYIYLADMGDNANARSTIIVYRIEEPTITGSNGTVDAGDIEAITMAYPAGSLPTHKDAETLLVDPDTGDMYIITKRESVPSVYYLAHASSYSGTQTLTDLGDMFDISDVSSISASGNAVGGNISPDGREILVKSYGSMYLFPRDKDTQTIFQALQQTPTTVDGYVGGGNTTYRKSHPSQEPQGEAVTFDYNGNHYYTASEFASSDGSTASRFPLFKYSRLSGTPTTVTLQDGVSPTGSYAGTIDTHIWDTNPTTTYGTEATIVVDTGVGVETDQRKGLLKFDVSSIPSNATIVGAHLELYISTEGQGWKMHRMLVDWDENSTYNTLTTGVDDDNTDASTVEDNRNGVTLDSVTGSIVNNMRLGTIQGWVDGTYTNYGWLLEGTDLATGDGQQFVSSEGVTSTQRPKLIIRYVTP